MAYFTLSEEMVIPDNIIFIFQPPYTPEVNPIERLWRYLKDQLQWYVFENLDLLRITLSKTLNKLNNSIVSSITCYTKSDYQNPPYSYLSFFSHAPCAQAHLLLKEKLSM